MPTQPDRVAPLEPAARRFASKVGIVVLWIALWIPLSTLFPEHPHFPAPQAAVPILFPLLMAFFYNDKMGAFTHAVLPALVFWGVLIGALRLRTALLGKKRS